MFHDQVEVHVCKFGHLRDPVGQAEEPLFDDDVLPFDVPQPAHLFLERPG